MAEHAVLWIDCGLSEFDSASMGGVFVPIRDGVIDVWTNDGYRVLSMSQGTTPNTSDGFFVTLVKD